MEMRQITIFEAEVKRNTLMASIPDEWFEKFLARIETWETDTSSEKQAEIDRLKAESSTVKARIDRINNGFADGSLDVQEFKRTQEPARAA